MYVCMPAWRRVETPAQGAGARLAGRYNSMYHLLLYLVYRCTHSSLLRGSRLAKIVVFEFKSSRLAHTVETKLLALGREQEASRSIVIDSSEESGAADEPAIPSTPTGTLYWAVWDNCLHNGRLRKKDKLLREVITRLRPFCTKIERKCLDPKSREWGLPTRAKERRKKRECWEFQRNLFGLMWLNSV